jgi:hypothetical protein
LILASELPHGRPRLAGGGPQGAERIGRGSGGKGVASERVDGRVKEEEMGGGRAQHPTEAACRAAARRCQE